MSLAWLTPDIALLLLAGIRLTIILTVITSLLSLAIGILIGTCRLAGRRIWRRLGAVHVEIHRNVPALVLIIFWAFVVPNLFPASLRQSLFFENRLIHWLSDATGLPLPYYTLAAILGLTLNTSAYLAELFRAGVGSLAQEYIDAARSLGASQQMVFWQILLPQGVRAAFPAIATRLIHNMKNTALASFVSAPEFFQMTQTAITYTFRAVEFLLLATAVYLLLALAFGALLRWIEHRLNRRPISVFVNSPTVVAKTGWR